MRPVALLETLVVQMKVDRVGTEVLEQSSGPRCESQIERGERLGTDFPGPIEILLRLRDLPKGGACQTSVYQRLWVIGPDRQGTISRIGGFFVTLQCKQNLRNVEMGFRVVGIRFSQP